MWEKGAKEWLCNTFNDTVYSRMSIAFPRKYYYVPNVRRHLSHFARWLTFWYHTGNSYAWISSFAQQAFRADLLLRPLKIYCGLVACVYWKGETLKSRYFYAIKCLFSIMMMSFVAGYHSQFSHFLFKTFWIFYKFFLVSCFFDSIKSQRPVTFTVI